MCVFNGGFIHLGPEFRPFGHNLLPDISCHLRNRMLDKIVFIQSRFFYFFSTACFFDIILPMFPQVLESTFSKDPWWSFKELCFRKDIH